MDKQRFPKVIRQGLMNAVERLTAPEIRHRWAFWLIVGMGIVVVAQAVSISFLLPQKEYIPYFIAEKPSGEVSVTDKVGRRFSPSKVNMEYFARKFVEGLLVVDEATEQRLREMPYFLKGAAVSQFETWINKQDRPVYRLQIDPSYRRSVEFEKSIEFISTSPDNISGKALAWVRLKIYEGGKVRTRRLVVNMDYALLPITSEAAVVHNPIGFYVTNFGFENAK